MNACIAINPQTKLIIVIYDLDFEIKYVAFETKVINRYDIFY